MIVLIARLCVEVLVVAFVITQVIYPMIVDRPLFPLLNKKSRRLTVAWGRFTEAKETKRAVDVESKVSEIENTIPKGDTK